MDDIAILKVCCDTLDNENKRLKQLIEEKNKFLNGLQYPLNMAGNSKDDAEWTNSYFKLSNECVAESKRK